MNIYWVYACEEGHTWVLFGPDDATMEEVQTCRYGHVVTMCKRCQLVEEVQASVRPAARIVDTVKNQIGSKNRYFIVITNLKSGQDRMSSRDYKWDDAVDLLARFKGVNWSNAERILDALDEV